MSNSLNELAKEYEHSIELLSSCIPDVRAKYKQATLEGNKDLIKTLAKKLAVMYEEIRDMKIIVQTLTHYYDDCDYDCGDKCEYMWEAS